MRSSDVKRSIERASQAKTQFPEAPLLDRIVTIFDFRNEDLFEVSRVAAPSDREVRTSLLEPDTKSQPLSRLVSQVDKPGGHLFDAKLMREASSAVPLRLASWNGRRSMESIRNGSCHDAISFRLDGTC